MQNSNTIHFARPTAVDGYDLNMLVADSPPLDTNSMYCNLLQCTHFADTSICARLNGKLAGFISGYIIPARHDTLFVWQVVVDSKARGKKVASGMLAELLKRESCINVRNIETTITEDNDASWALFMSFAKKRGAKTEVSEGFDKEKHFRGLHDTEKLLRIKLNKNINH